jgi:hypothetical protein
VHDREHLAALPDESEPLGPWRDESGLRSVHRSAVESLGLECPSGSGASGSVFASRTGFVTGLAATVAGLSTDFFGALFAGGCERVADAFAGVDLAAARPGLSADCTRAGFAAVTGLSVDFVADCRGVAATAFAGTSRVSVLKLA